MIICFNIIKIIKEEVDNYDFLGLDEIAKENDYISIINSKQFQTQFVNDVINDINNDSKFKKINTLYKSMSIDNAGFINEEPLHFDFEIEILSFVIKLFAFSLYVVHLKLLALLSNGLQFIWSIIFKLYVFSINAFATN